MFGIKNFKIIPLLVFVALMSFSVRVVDMIAGVSNISGSAYAEEEKKKEESPPAGHAEEKSGSDQAGKDQSDKKAPAPETEAKKGEGEKKADADAKSKSDKEDPKIKWRDPNDEDPGYTAARDKIFDDLSKRREDMDKRDRDIATREALLKAAEKELDRKFQELTDLRGEIEKLLQAQSEEEKARTESLVKVYEGMKPKDAARIFNTLDLDILVSVVSHMSERKLSPIMAQMEPERARTVTIMLAEQKQLPSLPESN